MDEGPASREQEASAGYEWVETAADPALEALSLTFVQPEDPAHLTTLGPRSMLPDRLTIAQALDASLRIDDFAWGAVIAQPDVLERWSVILEPNGWVTSMPEVLARLSRRGRAANIFWNVNAVMSFCWAIGGDVIRQFDPLLYDPADGLPEESGLPFGHPGNSRAAGLALLTRLTGIRVDPRWLLERPRPAFIVAVPANDRS